MVALLLNWFYRAENQKKKKKKKKTISGKILV
jgi:hypothetical protein